jgi:hypothetical protein
MIAAAPSLAALLDEVRPLLARAREEAGNPRYVLVPPSLYDVISGYRTRDREMGMPATVLGLEIVKSDDPLATPRVF